MLALPAAGLFPAAGVVPLLVVAAFAFGAAECLLGPAQGPLVVDLAPPELRGRYLAVLTNAYALGFTLGPPLGAALLAASPNAMWLVAAALLCASALAAVALERRVPEAYRRVPSS
jgi:MFS family permease